MFLELKFEFWSRLEVAVELQFRVKLRIGIFSLSSSFISQISHQKQILYFSHFFHGHGGYFKVPKFNCDELKK